MSSFYGRTPSPRAPNKVGAALTRDPPRSARGCSELCAKLLSPPTRLSGWSRPRRPSPGSLRHLPTPFPRAPTTPVGFDTDEHGWLDTRGAGRPRRRCPRRNTHAPRVRHRDCARLGPRGAFVCFQEAPCWLGGSSPLRWLPTRMFGNFEKDAWGFQKGCLGNSKRTPGEYEASDPRRSTWARN